MSGGAEGVWKRIFDPLGLFTPKEEPAAPKSPYDDYQSGTTRTADTASQGASVRQRLARTTMGSIGSGLRVR